MRSDACRAFLHASELRTVDDFTHLVERLAAMPPTAVVCNPYAGDDAAGDIRRANLTRYLERMAERRPRLLLVGEAPGYRGCRVTGVPFTSESILLDGPSPFGLFGETAGFNAAADSVWRREASASVMWETLVELDVLPLLWNAFPFHPHHPDRPDSNRAPSVSELETGRSIVLALLDLFAFERVIAVGNKASISLGRWGVPAAKVRHPGHGGRAAFRRELAGLLG